MRNLRKLRAIKGITQDELAKEMGLSRVMINLYESENYGKLSKKSAKKLSEFFGVSVIELYGFDNFKLLPQNDEEKMYLIKEIAQTIESEELKTKIKEIL